MTGPQSVIPDDPDQADYDPELRLLRTLAALGLFLGIVFTMAMPLGLQRLHQGSICGDLRAHLKTEAISAPSLDVIWMYIAAVAGTGLAAMLMVGSIGALRLARWSRPVLLIWGAGALLIGAIELYFAGRWLLPPWRHQVAQARGVVDTLSNLGGVGLMAMLAIALLVLLMRRKSRTALV